VETTVEAPRRTPVVQRAPEIEIGTYVCVIDPSAQASVGTSPSIVEPIPEAPDLQWPLGVVENFDPGTGLYTVALPNRIAQVSREGMIPMHTNASGCADTFESVMNHGVLSPAARERLQVKAAVTTADAKAKGYEKNQEIDVNMLTVEKALGNIKVLLEDILFNSAKGVYALAMENSAAPLLQMPAPPVSSDSLLSKVGRAKQVATALKPVLERRLLHTMLIIARGDGAQDAMENHAREARLPGLPPERFLYILVPEGVPIRRLDGAQEAEGGAKIIRVQPAVRTVNFCPTLFCTDQSLYTMGIDLKVPDYAPVLERILAQFSGQTLCTHLVRL